MSIRIRRHRAAVCEREIVKENGQLRHQRPKLSALGLPEDVLGGMARMTALGGSRVLVENHRGIVEIGRECVKLMTRQGVVAIHGEGLKLSEAREGALFVEGSIGAIEFPRAARREGGPDA